MSATAVVAALAAPAGAAPTAGSPFIASGYFLRIDASAVSSRADLTGTPHEPAAGRSVVQIAKDAGDGYGECRTVGAGVDDERALEPEDLPSELAVLGRLRNPTVDRDDKPNLSPGDPGWGRPRLQDVPEDALRRAPRDGPGWLWSARCHSDTWGTATADNVRLGIGRAAGSTAMGILDKRTLEYVGTARAYVAGLEGAAGDPDVVSSVVQVRKPAGGQPTVSYRIGTSATLFASGVDVPLEALTAQFNRSVAENADALTARDDLALILVGPSVGSSEDGLREVVHAPCVELVVGRARIRLVSASFETFPSP